MGETAKAKHDRLLAEMPEGAKHELAGCPFCPAEDPSRRETASEDAKGGPVDTLTKAEHEAAVKAAVDQAVAAATGPIQKELDDLKAAAGESEVEAKIEAAKTEAAAELAKVQGELDAKVLELKAATDDRDGIKTWLDGEKAKQEQDAEVAARKDERLAKVKEAASFPDEYLEANADRFAAMSDEDFEKALADWSAVTGKQVTIPKKTALTATAEDKGGQGGAASRAAVRDVMDMRFQGVDPRQIATREA